ncbi:MAG TPA: hypothetical protein VMN35_02725 [Gaiellaceae bacterium]|nr:hypothetical protein [Gaiellaceae bacterium]
MTVRTRGRFQAAVVAIAPAVLLFGFAYHPYLTVGTDAEAIAREVVADPTRWGIAHLALGLGYALMVLAFLAIRTHLREAGEERWSTRALPLAAFGSAVFVILPGMEFAPLAAAETGGDPEAAQEELFSWFVPMFVVGAVTLTLGVIGFAIAIVRSAVPSREFAWVVAGSLVVMAAARFVPLGAAQVVIGLAAVVALWPLAYGMWRHPEAPLAERARTPVAP